MNTVDIEHVKHQIIVVRRPHHEEDAHHGGVWKIAFADFMTAMMCFFLVMWLISATDEKTKAAVANYFNPVKLMDKNSSRKGLESIGDGPNAVGLTAEDPQDASNKDGGVDGRGNAGPSTEQNSAASLDEVRHSDEHLFADPYAVLAEIAAETGTRQNVSDKGEGGVQESGPATGASGGESYRDPFAPDFWTEQVATPLAAEASAERPKPEMEKPEEQTPPAPTKEPAKAEAAGKAEPEERPEQPKADAPAPKSEEPAASTAQTARQIEQELARAFQPGDKLHDGISVTASDKGVTISITDQLDFGMFEIGSAMPRRELVLAMEKIGKALTSQPGKISISGHTDARPFKSGTYDNWRLSGARAQSAYYMLVRAGLDEQRVMEVGGFADRKLKDAADPFAAANRRIEILLETGG